MTSTSTAADSIVIGAGVSGLVAADVLHRAGKSVLVLEARDRLGGRARSVETGKGTIDLGATWFWPNETLVQQLAERLKIDTFPQYIAGDALFEPDRSGVRRIPGHPGIGPSYRFAGGAQRIAGRLAETLDRKAIRLSEHVHAIGVDEDSVRVSSASGEHIARHIILAVPPAVAIDRIAFGSGLPSAVADTAAATEVWMGGTVKAVAVYGTPFWRERDLSGFAISYRGPFREFHDHSGPVNQPAALFAFAPATEFVDVDENRIAGSFVEHLARMFGPEAAHPIEVHITDWSREPATTPRRPLGRGTAPYGSDHFRQPVAGRLHWAGTETADAYAGHVEGAIRAGLRAARAVLENSELET